MKTIYLGAFLTKDSRDLLLERFPPKHSQVIADHLTLVFRPEDVDIALFPAGVRIKIRVLANVFDSAGHAVVVQSALRSGQPTPHITISCADGVKPVYSNSLFTGDLPDVSYEVLGDPLYLDAVLDTFPRSFPA